MLKKLKRNKEKDLLKIAISQGGYFTAKQALKAGFSYRAQKYYIETKHWVKAGRALYRFDFIPFSKYDEYIKTSFWSRDKDDNPQAVISHKSALEVHGIGDIIPGKIYFTVPKTFRKKMIRSYICHKEELAKKDIENREGFKVTTPVKAIIDITEKVDPEQLKKAIYDAYMKGLISQNDIEEARINDLIKRKLLNILAGLKINAQ